MLESVCWQRTVAHGGPMLEQSVPEDKPMERAHAGVVCEELQAPGWTHVEEGLYLMGRTLCWSRGRM